MQRKRATVRRTASEKKKTDGNGTSKVEIIRIHEILFLASLVTDTSKERKIPPLTISNEKVNLSEKNLTELRKIMRKSESRPLAEWVTWP